MVCREERTEKHETRILLVDDNVMSRAVIERRLIRDGYPVVAVNSGVEALLAVSREPVDLIFLDLVMEGMSGLEVMASLKSDRRYRHIPIVVISGVEDAGSIDDVKAAGAAAFLPKPVMAATLRQTVTGILTSVPAGVNGSEVLGTEKSPVIDPAFIERLERDYDKETTADFIAKFEEMAPGLRDAIMATATARPRAAHDLKGGARTLGLLRLAAICHDIERACSDGRFDDAANLSDGLSEYYDEALKALRDCRFRTILGSKKGGDVIG